MIEILAGAGIPLDHINVLVATGLHRPNPAPSSPSLSATKSPPM